MLCAERRGVGYGGVVAAELDLGLEPVFKRRQAELLEPRDLLLQERLVGEIGEGRPAPERERVAERTGPLGRRKRPRVAHEPLEAVRVDRPRIDDEHVTGRAGLDRPASEHPSQPRDGVLDDRLGRRGRLAAPEIVEEHVHRDDRAGVERQVGEHARAASVRPAGAALGRSAPRAVPTRGTPLTAPGLAAATVPLPPAEVEAPLADRWRAREGCGDQPTEEAT